MADARSTAASHHTTAAPAPDVHDRIVTAVVDSVGDAAAAGPNAAALPPRDTAEVRPAHSAAEAELDDSAKSLALLPSSGAQAQGEARSSTDGRDNQGKRGWMPSSAPIATVPTAILRAPTSPIDVSHSQGRSAAPSHAGGDADGDAMVDVRGTASAAPASSPAAPAAAARSSASSSSPPPSLSLAAPAALQHVGGDAGVAGAAEKSSLRAAAASAASLPLAPFALALSNLAAHFVRSQSAVAATSARAQPSAAASSSAAAAAAKAVVVGWTQSPAHCLILDASRIKDAPADAALLDAAIQADNAQETMQPLIKEWLPAGVELACAWTEGTAQGVRRLHLQFHTHADLSAALKVRPSLVRCGCVPTPKWHGAHAPCGPAKHLLPELLQLSCVPAPQAQVATYAVLHDKVDALLKDMRLQPSEDGEPVWWFPSSHAPRPDQPFPLRSVQQSAGLVINVLCRGLMTPEELAAAIARVHGKHELCSGAVKVHAPNMPGLCRCRECGDLGHESQACPRYAGRAVRLLFKKPIAMSAMHSLQAALKARSAYLAHAVGMCAPHHKVTLLFDVKEDDVESMAAWSALLFAFVSESGHLLLEAPRMVHTKDRMRECRACGTLGVHSCVLDSRPHMQTKMQQKPQASALAAAQPVRGARPAVAAASAAPAAGAMCRAWERTGSCSRNACPYPHPQGHTPASDHCRDFVAGRCHRDHCKFPHTKPGAAAASAPVAAAPAAAMQPQADDDDEEKKSNDGVNAMDLDGTPAPAAASRSPALAAALVPVAPHTPSRAAPSARATLAPASAHAHASPSASATSASGKKKRGRPSKADAAAAAAAAAGDPAPSPAKTSSKRKAAPQDSPVPSLTSSNMYDVLPSDEVPPSSLGSLFGSPSAKKARADGDAAAASSVVRSLSFGGSSSSAAAAAASTSNSHTQSSKKRSKDSSALSRSSSATPASTTDA